MNKQPVSYLQKDPRWKDKPYRVPGESSTIGSAGCGPSCAAMVIETLTGQTYTPEDACAWSLDHGYKALRQGTYYSYFKPQFAAFGIACGQLAGGSAYGKPDHPNHKRALELLREGYYLVACMGPGNWTSTGHFVLVWWADDRIYINDPNSTRADRINGDPETFFRQVKYYWWVDAREYNKEDDMDQEKFNGMFREAMSDYRQELRDNDSGAWSREAREWAVSSGLFAGSGTAPDGQPNYMWEDLLTREQAAQLFYRFAQQRGLV